MCDDKGKTIAQVVYTAYTVPGKNRPVTFAFNGGPGAASVFLNMGAIGPKIVKFGVNGDSPSEPAKLQDNPSTWLGFTDLVFIDPVGTGYSRSLVDDNESTRNFYSTDTNIAYLSQVVHDWLVKNGRMDPRKYITGESYGGFRRPRITYYLQTRLGVAMNGMVLASPYLDPMAWSDEFVSPMAWMTTLPSIAAAQLEREGKLGSRYDSNFTAWDQFPYSPHQRSGDPILNGIIAPTTTAMVHFVTQMVGWRYDGQYQTLNYKVNRLWHDDDDAEQGSVQQLREAVANDSNLRVLIAHGWGDLSCPFMVSVLAVDQMPAMGDPTRVEVKEYPVATCSMCAPPATRISSRMCEHCSSTADSTTPASTCSRPSLHRLVRRQTLPSVALPPPH